MHVLTKEMAEKAVELALPSIIAAMKNGSVKREAIHLVVAIRREGMVGGGEILFQHSINEALWEKPYGDIAKSKAGISLRTGLPTSLVQAERPDLLVWGDTVFYGSAVRGGIVTAASGVEPWNDEMFSGWVADACVALCKGAHAAAVASGKIFLS
ncbi:MAG: hypothetical protein WAX38_04380 [Minisyncoccia bacterium]